MDSIEVKRFVTKEFYPAEAMKTLRTNVMFCGTDVRTIAVTSFSAAEGKSTISFQLAASLAQTGRKVLLLDADLRKSVMASSLRTKGTVEGLTHLLSGMASLNEILTATDIPGLYVIFAGARVPNSAEVLGSKTFSKLMSALRETFDYVIVDAAPLGQVIDCAVMAPIVDGVLMVVDSTRNSYKLERRMKAQLEKANGKILGVVLNRVDMHDKTGYYGRTYGYGYGYGGEYGG